MRDLAFHERVCHVRPYRDRPAASRLSEEDKTRVTFREAGGFENKEHFTHLVPCAAHTSLAGARMPSRITAARALGGMGARRWHSLCFCCLMVFVSLFGISGLVVLSLHGLCWLVCFARA